MPLMEPRSPWARTHGEKTSIPSIRIDLAEFDIGKLLSCGRLTSNTRANSLVPFLLGTNLTRLQEQVKLKGCGQCARSVDRSSEKDASSSATRKSLFLASKSEMLTRKSLLLTGKSEMLARKSLFLIGKVKPNKNHSRLFIVSSKIWTLPSLSQ